MAGKCSKRRTRSRLDASGITHRRFAMQDVRPAAVAGMFYPRRARAPRGRDSRVSFRRCRARAARTPKALIVPHAGYVYSGPDRGHGYARLAPLRESVRRVVLLGPAHRVAVRGLAYRRCERVRDAARRGRDRHATPSRERCRFAQVTVSDAAARARARARGAAAVPANRAATISRSCRSPSATRRRKTWPR